MTATPRARLLARLTFMAAASLTLTSLDARAETAASAPTATLDANAKVSIAKASPVAAKQRTRQPVRVAAQPEPCSSFWCGRRQVSWLILGIGF